MWLDWMLAMISAPLRRWGAIFYSCLGILSPLKIWTGRRSPLSLLQKLVRLCPMGENGWSGAVGGAIARGGTITAATRVRRRSATIRSSIGTIETRDIDTSAQATVEAAADAAVTMINAEGPVVNTDGAGNAIGGTATTARARGGAVSLSTDIVTGDIQGGSDIGSIHTDAINTSARTKADASANARVYLYGYSIENIGNGGSATGGTVGDMVGRGGAITLTTDVMTGDVNAEGALGGIQSTIMDSSAAANANSSAQANANAVGSVGNAENSGDGGNAAGGTIGQVLNYAGSITFLNQVLSGDIAAESDIGHLQFNRIHASSISSSSTYAYAYIDLYASNFEESLVNTDITKNQGAGGSATSGMAGNTFVRGGGINFIADVSVGNIRAGSDISELNGDSIETTVTAYSMGDADTQVEVRADAVDFVTTSNTGNGGRSIGGLISDVAGVGGIVTMSRLIKTGHSEANSNIGNVNIGNVATTSTIKIGVRAQANAFAGADATVAVAENRGNGGITRNSRVGDIRSQGGGINLSTTIGTGDIDEASSIGQLTIGSMNTLAVASAEIESRADARAEASVNGFLVSEGTNPSVSAENYGDGSQATGGVIGAVMAQGGNLGIANQIVTGDIANASDVGRMKINNMDTSTFARVDGYANAYADSVSNVYNSGASPSVAIISRNRGDGGVAVGGAVEDLSGRSGTIKLSTQSESTTQEGPSSLSSLEALPGWG